MERGSRRRVAVIAGDGVGKEVIPLGCALLTELATGRGIDLELLELDLGADRYLRDGVSFPPDAQAAVRGCDAVLLGALGDPRVPDLGYARDILFGLRFGLDLYANIRPIQCLDDRLMPLSGKTARDCDMVVFRENTEGVYAGVGGNFKRGTADEVAITEDINTRKGVERILVAAFEHALRHGRRRVTMADKHNAMPHAHGLWKRTFDEVRERYPGLQARHAFVDALCMQMVRAPEELDVIVTNNLFGDIVTDLGAALQGGLGMAASANIHPGKVSMFEPVHGSAPDLAGRDLANPFATFLTIGMMLTHLGHEGLEAEITEAVRAAVRARECTRDVGGDLGTREAGERLIRRLVR